MHQQIYQRFEAGNRQLLKPLSVPDFSHGSKGLLFSYVSLAIISITKALIIVENDSTGPYQTVNIFLLNCPFTYCLFCKTLAQDFPQERLS